MLIYSFVHKSQNTFKIPIKFKIFVHIYQNWYEPDDCHISQFNLKFFQSSISKKINQQRNSKSLELSKSLRKIKFVDFISLANL